MSSEPKPFSQESHPEWNREPGIVIVPGSNYANEMQKFEQFPGRYGGNPGNAYTYRPFPKMVYRAEHWKGKACCMAASPDPMEYLDPREWERVEELAKRFSEKCQRIVKDQAEYQRAMEDGWRESPSEAVDYLLARDKALADATAHRHYEDRNMSSQAQAEAAAAVAEVGGEHLPEIPVRPRRRGRPRKNPLP